MKMDLVTSIAVTVVGTVLGFFVTNLVVAPLEDFSFPSVNIQASEASAYATLDEPNPDVFNYRALNPTVEVFVGECKEYGTDGKCLEEDDTKDDEENGDEEENENEDENVDFEVNEEDEDISGSSSTTRSYLDEWRDASGYTPTTTRPDTDEQENE